MRLVIRKPNKQNFYYGMLLIPLLKMAVVSMFPQYEFAFNMLLVAISIGLFWKMLIRVANRQKISSFSMFLILYNFFMLPFSVSGMNSSIQDIATFYGSALYHVAFCLAILLALKKDPRNLIHTWAVVMELLVVANAFSVILFPQGLYTQGHGLQLVKYWILGYDNDHVIPYIITLLLVLLDNYLKKERFFSPNVVFLFTLCIGVSLYLWTVTAFISLIVMAGLCFLYRFAIRYSGFFNIRTFVIIVFVVMMLIYMLALGGGKGGVLNDFLVGVLKKDVTFNSRSWIWARYLVNIRANLIFGNGYETGATLVARNTVHGAHNEWIQILYDGGLVHLFFYFAMLLCVMRKLLRNRNTAPAFMISVAIFAIMIIQMMVGCPKFYWLLLFTIGFGCDSLVSADSASIEGRKGMSSQQKGITVTSGRESIT